jgi:hypothetical protein
VNVFVGWRNRVGTFFSGFTLPIAVAAIAAVPPVVLYFAPLGLVVTLAGLILDCLGAITLAGGIWESGAARLRAQKPLLAEAISHMTRWQRCVGAVPLAVARTLGSADSVDASPTTVEEVVDVSWGLVMLCFGFLGQAVGTFLQLSSLR